MTMMTPSAWNYTGSSDPDLLDGLTWPRRAVTVIISSSTKPYEANLFKIDHIKIFLVIGTYTRMDREVFITSTAASRI